MFIAEWINVIWAKNKGAVTNYKNKHDSWQTDTVCVSDRSTSSKRHSIQSSDTPFLYSPTSLRLRFSLRFDKFLLSKNGISRVSVSPSLSPNTFLLLFFVSPTLSLPAITIDYFRNARSTEPVRLQVPTGIHPNHPVCKWTLKVSIDQSHPIQVFIIIAIAAVNSWGFKMEYTCKVSENVTATNTQGVYTFSWVSQSQPIFFFCMPKLHECSRLSKVKVTGCDNVTRTFWTDEDSAGGSAGFFYFVNVAALIYVIFVAFVYVIFWNVYQTEKRIPLFDLGATALFFILFFFCSSIWWAGANTIGTATSSERLTELFQQESWKSQNAVFSNRDVNNGKLAISVVCVQLETRKF